MFQNALLEAYVRATVTARDFFEDRKGLELMEYVVLGGIVLAFVGGLIYQYGSKLADLWQRMISLMGQ